MKYGSLLKANAWAKEHQLVDNLSAGPQYLHAHYPDMEDNRVPGTREVSAQELSLLSVLADAAYYFNPKPKPTDPPNKQLNMQEKLIAEKSFPIDEILENLAMPPLSAHLPFRARLVMGPPVFSDLDDHFLWEVQRDQGAHEALKPDPFLVVAFQGTTMTWSSISASMFGPLTTGGGKFWLHEGYRTEAEAAMKQVASCIDKLKKPSKYRPRLILTGHSKGGAVANCFLLTLMHNPDNPIILMRNASQSSKPAAESILKHVSGALSITFGAPHVLRSETPSHELYQRLAKQQELFERTEKYKPIFINIVSRADVIPCLPHLKQAVLNASPPINLMMVTWQSVLRAWMVEQFGKRSWVPVFVLNLEDLVMMVFHALLCVWISEHRPFGRYILLPQADREAETNKAYTHEGGQVVLNWLVNKHNRAHNDVLHGHYIASYRDSIERYLLPAEPCSSGLTAASLRHVQGPRKGTAAPKRTSTSHRN
ncbi:hypothetical protein ACK3TF_005748 [Chlorella vulgaris]